MDAPFDALSQAELRVAVLSARGCSNREIAYELYLSVNTIKTHVARLLKRIGAPNRAGAVATLMMDERFRELVGSSVSALELTA